MRHTRTAAALLPLGLLAACATLRPDRLIRIASGATSQNVCSGTFVTGLDPHRIYAEEIRPEGGMDLLAWALAFDVDRDARRVKTTVFGAFETVSAFHSGYGCRLEYPKTVPLPPGPGPTDEPPRNDIAGPDPLPPADPALARSLAAAFAPEESGSARATRAIVVVHDGRVIAERYAPGIGVDTPLLSHSIAKSVMNALIAILVREGKLSLDRTLAPPAWAARVNVDQLLRMTSGLPLDEGAGPGLAQQMWFTEPDDDAFAERTPLAARPGEKWAYGNLGYAALSRLVRDAAGGTPRAVAEFARTELFAPVGMTHATMEFDGAGSPMGGNAFFATARDWARFGLLYLNDGVADGRRILPEGWVSYSTRQTLNTGYGAGFWLNGTDAPMEVWPRARWGMPGVPKDAYFARGYLGQYIVVVPSEKLVLVRMGISRGPGGGIQGVGELVRDVIEALPARARSTQGG
jgi:CubicO group peptidase (beta-lactamase class C family)